MYRVEEYYRMVEKQMDNWMEYEIERGQHGVFVQSPKPSTKMVPKDSKPQALNL